MSEIVDALIASIKEIYFTATGLLPQLLGAAIVLLVAKQLSPRAAERVTETLEQYGLFDRLRRTPLVSDGDGAGSGGTATGVAATTSKTIEFYGYVLAVGIALTILDLGLISQLATNAVFYATYLVAGLALLALTALVATGVGARAAHWEPVDGTKAAPAVDGLVQAGLYLVAGVIVLDLLGLHTGIVFVLVETAALGIAIAFALAVGISVGLASKDHVADYVDDVLAGDRTTPAAEPSDD